MATGLATKLRRTLEYEMPRSPRSREKMLANHCEMTWISVVAVVSFFSSPAFSSMITGSPATPCVLNGSEHSEGTHTAHRTPEWDSLVSELAEENVADNVREVDVEVPLNGLVRVDRVAEAGQNLSRPACGSGNSE